MLYSENTAKFELSVAEQGRYGLPQRSGFSAMYDRYDGIEKDLNARQAQLDYYQQLLAENRPLPDPDPTSFETLGRQVEGLTVIYRHFKRELLCAERICIAGMEAQFQTDNPSDPIV